MNGRPVYLSRGSFKDRSGPLDEASMADTPLVAVRAEEIKYYKYEKSHRAFLGPRASLSVALITASGLILVQIRGLGFSGSRARYGNSVVSVSIDIF